MHKIAVTVLLALMIAPALAEEHVLGPGEEPKAKTATQKEDDARAVRAYQRSSTVFRTRSRSTRGELPVAMMRRRSRQRRPSRL